MANKIGVVELVVVDCYLRLERATGGQYTRNTLRMHCACAVATLHLRCISAAPTLHLRCRCPPRLFRGDALRRLDAHPSGLRQNARPAALDRWTDDAGTRQASLTLTLALTLVLILTLTDTQDVLLIQSTGRKRWRVYRRMSKSSR